jgi:hypothetical protein
MMDTRVGSGFPPPYGPPSLAANETRTLPVAGTAAGNCSVPATAQAVSANVTLWPNAGTHVQWLTLWPAGQPMPVVSTINDYQGTVFSPANGVTLYGINDAAIVPLGSGGAFNVFVTDMTNVFIDINGYYAAPSALALGAGTAAAPSLTFSLDANTGLYSPAAGIIDVTASGANILTVNSGGISVTGGIVSSGASYDGIFATSSAPNSAAILGQALSGSTTSCGVCGYNDSATGFGVIGQATTNGTGGRFLANSSGTALVAEQPVGTQVMKVDGSGIHAGPGLTGTPLAYGAFDTNGILQSGSSNISCSWNAPAFLYQCGIAGQNYYYLSYVANVTPFSLALAVTGNDIFGNLLIAFYNTAGAPIKPTGFQVVVYKP